MDEGGQGAPGLARVGVVEAGEAARPVVGGGRGDPAGAHALEDGVVAGHPHDRLPLARGLDDRRARGGDPGGRVGDDDRAHAGRGGAVGVRARREELADRAVAALQQGGVVDDEEERRGLEGVGGVAELARQGGGRLGGEPHPPAVGVDGADERVGEPRRPPPVVGGGAAREDGDPHVRRPGPRRRLAQQGAGEGQGVLAGPPHAHAPARQVDGDGRAHQVGGVDEALGAGIRSAVRRVEGHRVGGPARAGRGAPEVLVPGPRAPQGGGPRARHRDALVGVGGDRPQALALEDRGGGDLLAEAFEVSRELRLHLLLAGSRAALLLPPRGDAHDRREQRQQRVPEGAHDRDEADRHDQGGQDGRPRELGVALRLLLDGDLDGGRRGGRARPGRAVEGDAPVERRPRPARGGGLPVGRAGEHQAGVADLHDLAVVELHGPRPGIQELPVHGGPVGGVVVAQPHPVPAAGEDGVGPRGGPVRDVDPGAGAAPDAGRGARQRVEGAGAGPGDLSEHVPVGEGRGGGVGDDRAVEQGRRCARGPQGVLVPVHPHPPGNPLLHAGSAQDLVEGGRPRGVDDFDDPVHGADPDHDAHASSLLTVTGFLILRRRPIRGGGPGP